MGQDFWSKVGLTSEYHAVGSRNSVSGVSKAFIPNYWGQGWGGVTGQNRRAHPKYLASKSLAPWLASVLSPVVHCSSCMCCRNQKILTKKEKKKEKPREDTQKRN